jgi:hypothetical protein
MIQAISVCRRWHAVTEAMEITDHSSPLFELAGLLMRLDDHVASFIVNANDSIM